MAGFCAVLDGLMIGMIDNSEIITGGNFQPLNNYFIHWSNFYKDSDHEYLAQIPEDLFKNLKNTIETLENLLIHLIPKTIKGSYFSQEISPGHSRVHLSDEIQEKPFLIDLSLNFNNFDDDINGEHIHREQITNISVIEKAAIDEEVEEYFIFSQDRATPVINLDEIVEEVQERRSKTPSKMYALECSPEKNTGFFSDFRRLSLNGKQLMRSSDTIQLRPRKPKLIIQPPLLASPDFARKITKSTSTQELTNTNLLDHEDLSKIGMKEVYESLEKYAEQNHRPSRDEWMD